MKKLSKILWGIALVALGVVLGLKATGVLDFDNFFNGWWTLFIIVPSLISLICTREKIISLVALFAGVILLLQCRGVPYAKELIIPRLIVIIGLGMILKGIFSKKVKGFDSVPHKNATKNVSAVFSGADIKVTADDTFEGAELEAVFGAVKLDLRDACIFEDCRIDASAVFGGVDILLPENVRVVVEPVAIFGGVGGKKSESGKELQKGEGAVTVYVKAVCIFGGVDLK